MSKQIKWEMRKRQERLHANFSGTGLAFRYRSGLGEPAPLSPRPQIFDSRGKPISLPRVSILEREDAVP